VQTGSALLYPETGASQDMTMSVPVSSNRHAPDDTMSIFSAPEAIHPQIIPEMPAESLRVVSQSGLPGATSSINQSVQNPTDFGAFVVQAIARSSRRSSRLDQGVLRQCLGLASSFMVTDGTMNPEGGSGTWFVGFSRLIDLLVALHARNELELETFNAASKACSECWGAAGTWRGFEDCRDGVRTVAAKLKDLLDSNGRTYRGQLVFFFVFLAPATI
jgi:hypothetical protein